MLRKKTIVSILLTFTLVITLFPGFGATTFAAPADPNRAACYTFEEGNIARNPEVIQSIPSSGYNTSLIKTYNATNPPIGITASYISSSNGAADRYPPMVNNGLLVGESRSGELNSNFNSYGLNNGPVYIVLRWSLPYTIDATRVMWWSDGGGCSQPSAGSGANVTTLQWWDGSAWVSITGLKNASGASVNNIGVELTGTNNSNRTWNYVSFDPVVTDRIRLMAQKGKANGIGFGEWEVFGNAGDPELISVSVGGNNQPVVSTTNTYNANVVFPNLPGATYEWSVSNDNIRIIGSNTGSSVSVEAAKVGAATLSVTVKHDSGVKEVSNSMNINVQNISVSVLGDNGPMVGVEKVYTATAVAGTLPITYTWSLDNANGEIVGSNTNSTVTVKGLTTGTSRLTCTIADAASGLSASAYTDITFKVLTVQDYIGATAAGRAPILPKRVVVDALRFDTPTASVLGNITAKWPADNRFDFGESFEASLVPVVWDMSSFSAADWAANKVGTTFTVTGVTAPGSRAPGLAAKAVFTVNQPLGDIDYNHSVTSENVIFDDVFWTPKQQINATTTFNQAVAMLESTSSDRYAVQNFKNSINRLQRIWNGETVASATHYGYVFQDSDVYKTLEGFAYTLAANWNDPSFASVRDSRLAKVKEWIEMIETVQYADGYVNTNFTTRNLSHRWRTFTAHEMYVMGHFLESVGAYTRFAVANNIDDPYALYEVGRRVCDHIVNTFSNAYGFRMEVPGHEEIELGMMKFATLCEEYEGVGTGQKYRDCIEDLVDRRGRKTGEYLRESTYYQNSAYNIASTDTSATYSQDYMPLVMETRAVGHAVRAMYFYTGATDVAISMPNSNPNKIAFLNGITNIYNSVSERNSYITGGLGSGESSEGFGPDWHIRNTSGYTETCAAIAGANWYQRLNLYYEDAKYADSYERALYNGVIVGVTLEGNRFAYGTGLDASTSRAEWQGCACCPPNVLRTVANASGYMYTVDQNTLFVNMFGGSTGNINIQGDEVKIEQVTQYPWEGDVEITVTPPVDKTFTLNLRLPGWVKAQKYQQVTLLVDGVAYPTDTVKGYIPITRVWPKEGTGISYSMPMEVRLTEGDINVTRVYTSATNRYSDSGQWDKVVVERGPIVYTLEVASIPNGGSFDANGLPTATSGRTANQVRLPRDMEGFKVVNRLSGDGQILRGVYTIEGMARYNTTSGPRDQWVQFIPYYCKTNRGANPSNKANTTSSTSSDLARLWVNATEDDVLIRGDKYNVEIGGTVALQANPKVNDSGYYEWLSGTSDATLYSAIPGASLSYEWSIASGADVIEMVGAPVATKTDDEGPGKIGGVDYTFDASTAEFKAKDFGVATVQVAMKNAAGVTLATDTYYVEVFGDISASNSISIVPESGVMALTSLGGEYSTGFTLVPKANMQLNMIIAEYNSRGALIKSEVRPISLTANVSAFEALDIGSDNTTKVFFWDANFVPLANVFYG